MLAEPMIKDGRADFDFLMGNWKVHHKRLKERLKGSTTWEDFEGTLTARPLLNGLGNIDESLMHRTSGPVQGVGIRFFDANSHQWTIYWADGSSGFLLYPMVGGFEDGRGIFYAHEPIAGKMIFTRFIWSEITEDSCKWEQAFSADGGKTWETNWVMTFERELL